MGWGLLVLTFRSMSLDEKTKMVNCGGKDAYQVQVQSALSAEATLQLLQEEPDPHSAPDEALAELAVQVNEFFESRAKVLLARKRASLQARVKAGELEAHVPGRVEVTVLLSEKGLHLAYSYAMARKEVAPIPRKSLLRRMLGPLYPGRKFWVMPEGSPPTKRSVKKGA